MPKPSAWRCCRHEEEGLAGKSALFSGRLSGSFPWASLSRHQQCSVNWGWGAKESRCSRRAKAPLTGLVGMEGNPSPSSRALLPGGFEERLEGERERDACEPSSVPEGKATCVYKHLRPVHQCKVIFERDSAAARSEAAIEAPAAEWLGAHPAQEAARGLP